MVYDAMSVHQEMMLSMKVFKRAMDENLGQAQAATPAGESFSEENVFGQIDPLPALHEVGNLLVAETMKRAEGNQSIACRLLGISQPALSKRLKKMGYKNGKG
jgi:DNA-binding NtrC family response regulator